MKVNTVYIVLNRIYDVLESTGLGAKNTIGKYKLETAFVNENGTLFSADKNGVKSRITVGDLTLVPATDNNQYVVWKCDAKTVGRVFSCIDKAQNDIFKTFLATLTGQNIPCDKLLAISEIAAALVVEYFESPEYYAVRSIISRNETIAALYKRAVVAEDGIIYSRAVAEEAEKRVAAAEKRAEEAEKRVAAAEKRAEEAEKSIVVSAAVLERVQSRARDAATY